MAISNFQNGRRLPPSILTNSNFQLLVGVLALCIIVQNFIATASTVRRYGDFKFFKMATVRHLGF